MILDYIMFKLVKSAEKLKERKFFLNIEINIFYISLIM